MSAIEIPGYKIVRTLGVGGQATVYLAIQQGFEREVALKIMSPALAADPSFGERFIREAKIVAKLSHKSIVTVYDAGQSGNFYYLAMEYMPGADLKGMIANGMKTKDCLSIIRKLAKALHFAHEKGYIHRDVKSENILFNIDGEPVLTDFGIAKASNSSTQMTQTGKLIGTPEYMSPEQCRGKTVDGRSDLYSLGIIFYEMLTRKVPFTGEDSVSICIKHVTKPIPQLPARLNHYQWLIDQLLSKEPEKRFQSGKELAEAIVQYEGSGTQTNLAKITTAKNSNKTHAGINDSEVTAVHENPDNFDDLHTERRVQNSKTESTSIVPKLAVVIAFILLVIGGFISKDKWYPQTFRWVNENVLGNKEPAANQEVAAANTQSKSLLGKNTLDKTSNSALPEQTATINKPTAQELILEADALVQFQPQKISDIKKALKLLAAVNTLEPSNKNASLIYQNILSTSLVEATNAADTNNFQLAEEWLALVEFEDSGYPLLAGAKANIAATKSNYDSQLKDRSSQQSQIDELILQGDLAIKEKRLSSPPQNNAIEFYQQVLQLDPQNSMAKDKMLLVANEYVKLIETAIDDNAFSRAKTLLTRYNSLSDDQSIKSSLQQKIMQSEKVYAVELKKRSEKAAREEEIRLAEAARENRLNDPMIQMQLLGNLDSAKSLERQGALVLPEFDNATAKYQAVLNIDSRNTDAQQGLVRIEKLITSKLTEYISTNEKEQANLWLTQLKLFNDSHPEYEEFKQLIEQILEPVEEKNPTAASLEADTTNLSEGASIDDSVAEGTVVNAPVVEENAADNPAVEDDDVTTMEDKTEENTTIKEDETKESEEQQNSTHPEEIF